MATVIPWTEIEQFHNIRKFSVAYPDLFDQPIHYKSKIKLHGTCAGIQTGPNPTAQSRTTILDETHDNYGFGAWVKETEAYWNKVTPNLVIFGEWSGPGIQKGVSLSQLSNRIFAIFAARPIDPEDDRLFVEPEVLEFLVKDIPNTYVLPWHSEIIIDWKAEVSELEAKAAEINKVVTEVEKEDPWVKSTFGVSGTGEGIVSYPVSHPGLKNFANYVFKSKGEQHKMVAKAAPAQVNPEVAASVEEFVALVLTPARLDQGLTAVGCDAKLTGKFIAWISGDVQKECQDELEASSLTWKQVSGVVTTKARTWYLEQTKLL